MSFFFVQMIFFLNVAFHSFPNRQDALLSDPKNPPIVAASGSLGLYHGNSKCVQTHPNHTILVDKKLDWCSNSATSETGTPWIQFSFPDKRMKVRGYSLRNGCCYYSCCCNTDSSTVTDFKCCCELNRFFLQGSNDNTTWKTIHTVDGDADYNHYCHFKTFDFQLTESYQYVRVLLGKARPGCQNCMQINQIELYGELFSSLDPVSSSEIDNDESVSIIGKVKKT